MYCILDHVYAISYGLNQKPKYFTMFSVSGNPNSTSTFEGESPEDLADIVGSHIESLKMSRQRVECTFDNTRKYSNRGGTIKYQIPFSPSEEKVFIQRLTEKK